MKFKKGDTVKILDTGYNSAPSELLGTTAVITDEYPTESTPHYGLDNGYYYQDEELELVSQPSRKVIGYKLLKESPTIKAGAIYKWNGEEYTAQGKYSEISIDEEAFQQAEWFEPIYEEEKVVVELSNGKVEIQEGNLKFIDLDNHYYNVKPNYLKELKEKLTPSSFLGYQLQVLTFKVGCQTFTMEDLEKVLAAIPQPVEESVVKVGLKFYTYDQKLVYTVYKVAQGRAWVNWEGDCEGTSYDPRTIERFLSNATWTIVN